MKEFYQFYLANKNYNSSGFAQSLKRRSIARSDNIEAVKVSKLDDQPQHQKTVDVPPPPPLQPRSSSSSSSVVVVSATNEGYPPAVYRPVESIVLNKKTYNSNLVYKEYIGKEIVAPEDTLSIVGDGNCFFRALSAALTNDQHMHQELRKMTVAELSKNFKLYEPYMDKDHADQTAYIAKMAESGTWVTASEIFAIATRLRIGIYVYIMDPKIVKTAQWVLTTPIGKSKDQINCVYLQLDHDHYTCVSKFVPKS